MGILLEARGLAYEYDGVRVLDSVDFFLNETESLALIGANGSGKSTLLQLIVGVLKPSEGALFYMGEPVVKQRIDFMRKKIGLVFQNAEHQLFCNTVYEDVIFGPLNMGYPEPEANGYAMSALRELNIAHLERRAPHRLSYGERQLCAIASVLSMRPEIILMDEPSAGLDPRARRELILLLNRLPQAKIIATHDLDLAMKTCSRAAILHDGRIAAEGATRRILSDGKLLEDLGL